MSTIVKETVGGKVEVIDPLHPTSAKQLGRTLDEVAPSDKSNDVGGHSDVADAALDVPPTAAATSLLVDGGKTEDPRASPVASLEVDPSKADPHTQAMEDSARAEASQVREAHRQGQSSSGATPTQRGAEEVSKGAISQVGLMEKTPAQVEREKQEAELRQKYPQIEL